MRVNEIFYSLQGEGVHTGMPMVFVRLSGCNLRCPFCDTQHDTGTELSEEQIVEAVSQHPQGWVAITGGEPSLQLTPTLVDRLHQAGFRVAVETNGTRPLPIGVDWITLSPKDAFLGQQANVAIGQANELKLLFDGEHAPSLYPHIAVSDAYCLQPLDTGNPEHNARIARQATEYVMQHPIWRLSLQIHKILNIR